MSEGIYDEYHDRTYHNDELQVIFDKYVTWCKNNGQKQEVSHIGDIDESNIGHVAYHANMVESK